MIAMLLLSMTIHAQELFQGQFKTADGKELTGKELLGKATLIVNIATRCGYTGQLDEIEKLYQKYQSKGFKVVGIPSNDFGGQTPESNEEVGKFCRLKYGASFPILTKQKVIGADRFEVIKTLDRGQEIKWNFEKFLVDSNGQLIKRFESATTPTDPELSREIEKLVL